MEQTETERKKAYSETEFSNTEPIKKRNKKNIFNEKKIFSLNYFRLKCENETIKTR